jgi:hypothetical protein
MDALRSVFACHALRDHAQTRLRRCELRIARSTAQAGLGTGEEDRAPTERDEPPVRLRARPGNPRSSRPALRVWLPHALDEPQSGKDQREPDHAPSIGIQIMASTLPAGRLNSEWLEADGLGGFASGTVSGIRTRRYHALLLVATTPPTGRMVLVNGLEVWLETPGGRFALSAQRYTPDVIHPDGHRHIAGFEHEPWVVGQFEYVPLSAGARIASRAVPYCRHG